LCLPCGCDARGSLSPLCDIEDGSCDCKSLSVAGDQCNHCASGYWNLSDANPDGCAACNCYQLGSRGICDEVLGCSCLPGYTGIDCAQCGVDFLQQSAVTGSSHVCTACPAECSGGCTGLSTVLGAGGCTACRNDRFVNGSVTTCVPSCAALAQTQPDVYFVSRLDSSECGLCDGECFGGCTDVGPSTCFRCRSVEYDGSCRDTCPPFTWVRTVSGDSECLDCDAQCSGGCHGPTAADCDACANVIALDGTCVDECDYSVEYLEPPATAGNPPRCLACDPLCDEGCSGAGPARCVACPATAYWSWVTNATTPVCTTTCDMSNSFVGAARNGELRVLTEAHLRRARA
jgi:hypothetical protein